MKKTLAIFLMAFVVCNAWSQNITKKNGAYLFTFFSDPTHSLFMAVSYDGYEFTAVNDGNPVIDGNIIAEQRGIRDPHIFRGPDGAFYLSMTDLHIFGQQQGKRTTEWERDGKLYGWGNNRGIVLMKSHDLIHWTRSNVRLDKLFPDEFGDICCFWAPETTYDPVAKKLMIYFTVRKDMKGHTELYWAYVDDDYNTLTTKPKLLFTYPDPKIAVLDADICPMPDGRYAMTFVAQERGSGIKMAISDNGIHGDYKIVEDITLVNPTDTTALPKEILGAPAKTGPGAWVDAEPRACEAPNAWKRIGEDKWVVMYDIFGIRPHNFGFVETTDFKTFIKLGRFGEGVMKANNFKSPKHGAVIHITKKEARRLEKYWKKRKK